MEYILSLSYGKDSMACLGAIEHLGWPLDRIVTADVWATETIPAEYPQVTEFKAHADRIIKERYGIEVEHYCAKNIYSIWKDKATYEDGLYYAPQRGKYVGSIKGFPMQRGPWCNHLKLNAIKQEKQKGKDVVQYLGIAADEPSRIASHINKPGIKLPLVEIGWEEEMCGLWCKYSGLLSPIYTSSMRDGCWFCHNQSVDQLRKLRREYPDLWGLLLQWDIDSPTTFKPGSHGNKGHTVHDFEKRFQMEDEGLLAPGDTKFKWKMIDL